MTGAVLSVVAVILIGGSGLAVAAMLRLPRLSELVLAAYVLAFAEVVALMLILSAVHAMTRVWILAGVAALFVLSVTRWVTLGAPRPRLRRLSRHSLRALASDRILLVLAVATGLALLYVIALIVGTPPNNGDSLSYHLARAAFWLQSGRIGYVSDAYDERLNVNPPNAEIVMTLLLEVGQNERLAGFVQFTAALALSLGVYSLARRLTLSPREAIFGALLFLTLPIVLLQSSTTQNDLVAAAFLLVAGIFVLGDTRNELVIAALAVALAIGTKVPAAYGLPILAILAVATPSRTLRMRRTIALALGVAVGSYWYVVNIDQTGRPLGKLPDVSGLVTLLEPTTNLLAAFARLLDALDLSGSVGADVLVYVVVAIGATILLAVNSGRSLRFGLVVGASIVVPIALVLAVSYSTWRGFAKLHDSLEAPDRLYPVEGWDAQTTASESFSWFGPLGFILVVVSAAAVIFFFRHRSVPRLAVVLAMAPLVSFALLSISLGYDPWQGRFFVFPVALSATLWGVVLRARPYAAAASALAVTTAALSLVHFVEKPSGLRLFERAVPASVWGAERWEVQSIHEPETPPSALRFLAELPRAAVVGLALGFNDFGYPAFGPGLDRSVELIPVGSNARMSGAEWLLANASRASEIDRKCWRVVRTTPEGWVGFSRSATCPS